MVPSEDDLTFVPDDFSGRVRLFPLPNLVLFPHVIQPLHVFERRYVELFLDAVEGDRLIAMSLLEPGWESDYEGRPPIAPVACLGRIITWQAQGSARYNLLLLGMHRARIVRELPPDRSFREADVELLADSYSPQVEPQRCEIRTKLLDAFQQLLPNIPGADELFSQLSLENVSLGALTDVIGYALDLGLHVKQKLLGEPCVDRRASLLISHLDQALDDPSPLETIAFPPSFSPN